LIYVPDVDSAFRQAVEAGGTEKRAVEDQFYGDRAGTLEDPFGHQWTLATHVEDVPEDELQSRMEQFSSKQKQSELA
jgi:PhnB protein